MSSLGTGSSAVETPGGRGGRGPSPRSSAGGRREHTTLAPAHAQTGVTGAPISAVSAPTSSGAPTAADVALPAATTGTSAGAAFTRSLLLFMGFMFRRPSKLFRPNRLDTWAGLRRLAESADQNLSPAFVRGILKLPGGPFVLTASLLPPLLVNTTLGFLLFSSHSLLSLGLARLPYFQRGASDDDFLGRDSLGMLDGDYGAARPGVAGAPEEEITFETILRGPRTIPKHPTLLSAIAGAGAGVIQGMAFTPIENVVRFLQQSASFITSIAARILHVPTIKLPKPVAATPVPSSPLEALRNLFAADSWHKDRSWWTGWRWAVARDAVSYSIFFAAFDITRRLGLRVKMITTRKITGAEPGTIWAPSDAEIAAAAAPPRDTPTKARLAQAATIVAGGIAAASAAEAAGRPFRTCQRLTGAAAAERARLLAEGKPIPEKVLHPVRYAWRKHGIRVFLHRDGMPHVTLGERPRGFGHALVRTASRIGWRVAAVGPWGVGFLVFAWIGGEV